MTPRGEARAPDELGAPHTLRGAGCSLLLSALRRPGGKSKGHWGQSTPGEPSLQGGDGQGVLVHRGHPENHGVPRQPQRPPAGPQERRLPL